MASDGTLYQRAHFRLFILAIFYSGHVAAGSGRGTRPRLPRCHQVGAKQARRKLQILDLGTMCCRNCGARSTSRSLTPPTPHALRAGDRQSYILISRLAPLLVGVMFLLHLLDSYQPANTPRRGQILRLPSILSSCMTLVGSTSTYVSRCQTATKTSDKTTFRRASSVLVSRQHHGARQVFGQVV